MADIIDNRRTKPATENRQRYLEHKKTKVQNAIRKTLDKINIKDLQDGKDVDVHITKDYSNHDIGLDSNKGTQDYIGSGNRQHQKGDSWEIPSGGGRGNEGGLDSDGENDFDFTMTAKEFMDIFFDSYSLEFLPKEVQIEGTEVEAYRHAGFVTDGSPARLSIVRTYRNSIGRTSAERADYEEQIENTDDEDKKLELEEKIRNIPLFREVDLRFAHSVPEPMTRHRGVMFCLMDVSWSMEAYQVHLAKQFFLLVYVFLSRRYKGMDVVFIRHTDTAGECTEEEFFHNNMTGGTRMSSALLVMEEIIKDRYDPKEWNIFAVHVSDGGNYQSDDEVYLDKVGELINNTLSTMVYVETPPEDHDGEGSDILMKLEHVKTPNNRLKTAMVTNHGDIFRSFTELFQRDIGVN